MDQETRSARQLLAEIWKSETGQAIDPSSLSHLVDRATVNGRMSFRRAVQLLTVALGQNGGAK